MDGAVRYQRSFAAGIGGVDPIIRKTRTPPTTCSRAACSDDCTSDLPISYLRRERNAAVEAFRVRDTTALAGFLAGHRLLRVCRWTAAELRQQTTRHQTPQLRFFGTNLAAQRKGPTCSPTSCVHSVEAANARRHRRPRKGDLKDGVARSQRRWKLDEQRTRLPQGMPIKNGSHCSCEFLGLIRG